ncbi:MAG: alpha/beta fold hydrolase, partial [Mycobacterium sp.]
MGQRKTATEPGDMLTPKLRYRTIHGYRRAFRIAGSGPALLLIHGIGDNSTTWEPVHSELAKRFTVIAPDLLGHGKSDKPRADYSVAAYANGMRDLLSVLDIDRVTVVGHSLGGGVAMQFAYQFPQLVERMILVGAGGVTRDVNIALRFAALPIGGEALALLRLPLVLPALQVAGHLVGAMFGSTRFGRDIPNMLRILADLPEPTASAAFTRTLRA